MTLLDMLHSISSFVRVRLLARKAIIDDIIFRCHYRVTCALLLACCTVVTATNLIGKLSTLDRAFAIQNSFQEIRLFVRWKTRGRALSAHFAGLWPPTRCLITPPIRQLLIPESTTITAKRKRTTTTTNGFRSRCCCMWVTCEGSVTARLKFMFITEGNFVLRLALDLEELGGREDGCDLWRHEGSSDVAYQWAAGAPGDRGALSRQQSQHAWRLRHSIFFLRISKFRKCGKHHQLMEDQQSFSFLSDFQLANIFLMDKFLGGAFLTYGIEVLKYSSMNQWDRADPMIKIFPRMTKCRYQLYGPSGTVSNYGNSRKWTFEPSATNFWFTDLLCILPLNVLNEKVYIFLWWVLNLT